MVVRRSAGVLAASLVWAIVIGSAAAEPLPQDNRIISGTLPNGVTWMYRQHDNPPDKLALMVHVRTGSLNETDAQRGLAHFMEHMCFNGTEHYAPGTLIKYFESIGMEFGADLNAFTSFDQTVYMLFLPDTAEEEVDKGVMTLSDYVFRALLLPEEIDKERGVVLAEWRTGRGAQQRILDQELSQVFAGTRFAERLPIGLPEVIEHAPYDEFKKYYKTWYRPENITVMAVGDAPIEKVKPAFDKWFGEYKADTTAGEAQKAGFKPFTEDRAFVITDPELGDCTVDLTAIEPGRPPVTTVEQARTELVESVAAWIVNRRLDERVQNGEAAYQNAGVRMDDFFHDGFLVNGSASGESKDWSKMLDELVVEIVRAREHGFTERELQLARKEILSDAQRRVETEPTRNARGILFGIMSAVNDRVPISSAAQDLELNEKLLPTLQLAEISESFGKHYSDKSFAFTVTMPEKEGIKIPAPEEVLTVAKAALSRRTEAPKENAAPTTLLESEPVAGNVMESATDDDIQVTSAWLDNGVRVHHRYMDYKKDTVLVSILLAGGQIEETEPTLGLTEVAATALRAQPATSRLTSTNVRDIMTGVNIGVSAGASDDTVDFRISGSPNDLEKGLELAHALLTDGKIEESFVKNWKLQQEQQRAMLEKMPRFKAFEALAEVFYGGDVRRRPLLAPERVEAITTNDVQKWYDRIRATAPIEVAVVGDVDKDTAMKLVSKYIGSLPKRDRSASRLDPLRKITRPKGPMVRNVVVDTVTPQAMTLAGFVGCEEKAVFDVRGLELAAHILSSRLIETIRENMSLVYSLRAMSRPSDAYNDSGMFGTWAPCAPEKAEQVVDEVHKIYKEFAEKGPTEEELTNAKKQIENDLDEEFREPSYWLVTLRDIDYHGRSLADEKAEPTAYQPYTVDDIVKIFRKYYTPERSFKVTAVPAPEGSKDAGSQKSEENPPS
ncbi:MAG: insulinase family protein [Phycisphaerales bacterium]|nr:insulinase family protein [Phycisphaerales bacterium]